MRPPATGTGPKPPASGDYGAPSVPATPPSGPYTPVTPAPAQWSTAAQSGHAAPTKPANTNGYATPGFTMAAGKTAIGGYDAGKMADASHQSPKYVVGRILTNFPDTAEGLGQALPHIQQAYPGTQLVGKDKLNIPGVGIIDVGKGFSAGGGQGWQWYDEAAAAAAAGQAAPVRPASAPPALNSLVSMLSMPGGGGRPAPSAAPTSADPFGGSGVFVNGGWVPGDHPLAQQATAMATAGPKAPPVTTAGAGGGSAYAAPATQSASGPIGAWNGGRPVQAPNAQQGAPPTPYQTYDLQARRTGTISPSSIASFKAPDQSGLASRISGAGQVAAPPAYDAGTISQYGGGQGGDALQRAAAALATAGGLASPGTANALKESQKETLSQLRNDQREALLGGAAQRGTLGAGTTLGLEALLGDDFAANLTKSYRDIDIAEGEKAFGRQMDLAGAFGDLGGLQGSEGRADFASRLAGQTAQEGLNQDEAAMGLDRAKFGADQQDSELDRLLSLMGLQGSEARDNYATGLAGNKFAADLDQQAFDQGVTLDELGLTNTAAANKAAMDRAMLAQQSAQDTNAYNLDATKLLSDQLLQGDQLGFDYAALGQEGQLAQQDMELRRLLAQMGIDFDKLQLDQQGQQFTQQHGLNTAIAQQNATQAYYDYLLDAMQAG